MASTIRCDIVSAEAEIFHGEAEMIVATGEIGELGIAPRHAPLITRLKPGKVVVTLPGGEKLDFVISGGILEVQPQVVTVLADTAIRAQDIDEASVLAAEPRLLHDLRHLAPDLLRWHLFGGGLQFAPGVHLPLLLAQYPKGPALVVHPRFETYGPHRLRLSTDTAWVLSRWDSSRHLWDARYAARLLQRLGGGDRGRGCKEKHCEQHGRSPAKERAKRDGVTGGCETNKSLARARRFGQRAEHAAEHADLARRPGGFRQHGADGLARDRRAVGRVEIVAGVERGVDLAA